MRFDYAFGGERAGRERGWVSVCALDGEALLEVCVTPQRDDNPFNSSAEESTDESTDDEEVREGDWWWR